MMNFGPAARIFLRYIAAALVSYGILPIDVGAQVAVDPDLIAMTGAALGAAVEGVYALAKRRGWAT